MGSHLRKRGKSGNSFQYRHFRMIDNPQNQKWMPNLCTCVFLEQHKHKRMPARLLATIPALTHCAPTRSNVASSPRTSRSATTHDAPAPSRTTHQHATELRGPRSSHTLHVISDAASCSFLFVASSSPLLETSNTVVVLVDAVGS